jgi:hypothetical protein
MEGGTVGSWIKLGEMVVAFILMSVRTFIQRVFRAFGLFFIYFDNFSKILTKNLIYINNFTFYF